MAARGLVPVNTRDQVTMLAQLTADADADVATAARHTLGGLPADALCAACADRLHSAILDRLAQLLVDPNALGNLVANQATDHRTVVRLAAAADDALCERIAVNEARLLEAPEIIEALYKNRNTRMSTADRVVELAARHGLKLPGVPIFDAHVAALQGELIAEADENPLPQDEAFARSLAADANADAYERDKYTGEETLKPQFKPLTMQIMDMTKAEKLRLSMIGNAAARAILARDKNKQIAMAAVSSPQMTLAEACDIARSREVSEEILRYLATKREWVKSGELKHNLVFNPKTPVSLSMRFLSHLRLDELRRLARNRNVPGQLRSLAGQWIQRRERR